MKLPKTLSFILTSITAGLAAAIVVLILRPELLQQDAPTPPARTIAAPPVSVPIPAEGPVSYAAAVQRAAPSVVNIYTAKVITERPNPLLSDPIFKRFFGDGNSVKPRQRLETSLGSGVILDSRGFILTNNHVIKDADEIQLVLADGRNIPAVVVGSDPDTDLAVLYVHTEDLPAIAVADSQQLRVGDVVLAIGNPFGVGQTVTMGIVSATGRSQLGINTFENFIQTDAAINPGNSGGALINAHGQLVGINTAIFSKSGGSQGIGFAIPADLAKGIMQQILGHGRVVRGWLGVIAQDITPALADSFGLQGVQGVLISGILEHGPADRAGIEPGDIITHINGQAPRDADDLLYIIAMQPPGSVASIEGWRANHRLKLKAMIAERPANFGGL